MQKKIITILIIIILKGCNYKSQSNGLPNDVIIIASKEDKILLEPYIISLFNQPIYTPQEENIFNLKWINPWEINKYKKHHNILLLSLQFPQDTTGDVLSQKYIKSSHTEEKLFLREDIYSNDQIFMSIRSFDIIDFKNIIDNNSFWITNVLKDKYYHKIKKHIYTKGLNAELMSYLKNKYIVEMDVQEDYMIIRESNDTNFLWLGRGYPYRWITFFKENNISNKYSFWNKYESLSNKYMPEIYISKDYRSQEKKILNSQHINIYRGIYEHPESDTGGPFFVYEIKDIKKNEIYLLSGYVNYPGNKKINLIKGIEVLFDSFKILKKNKETT